MRPVCRQCAALKYRSQYAHPLERAIARYQRTARQLGVEHAALNCWVERPHGMHRATYVALRDQLDEDRLRVAEAIGW